MRKSDRFKYDPSLVLYLPLGELDGDKFMSRDAYGHLCAVTGATWTPNSRRLVDTENLLWNSDFEVGDPPTGWTKSGGGSLSRSNAQVKIGSYSGALVNGVADWVNCQQSVSGYARYAGRKVTFGAWVYATVAGRVSIRISDGIDTTVGDYHSGSGSFEWLKVTRTIDASPTNLLSYITISAGAVITAYLDGAILFVTTDYINIDSALTPLVSTTAGTWMAWLKLDDATPAGTTCIITFGDTSALEFVRLAILTTGKVRIDVRDAGVTQWEATSDAVAISDGVYVHLALIQNGTSPILLVNGVQADITFSVSTDKTGWFSVCTGLDNGRIGCSSYNTSGNIDFITNGNVGEVLIYNRALPVGEIVQRYQETKWKYA